MSEVQPAEAEVREKLVHLQQLKERLDEFDAEISRLVPQAEAMLASLRLGVPISLKMDEDEDGWVSYLTFEKVGKAWRLCILTGIEDGNNEWDTKPLSDVQRDRRAEVFERFLPDILSTAVVEMETRVGRRAKAIASTKNLVETVARIVAPTEPALGVFRKEGEAPHPAMGDAITKNPLFKAVSSIAAVGAASMATKAQKEGRHKDAASFMDAAKNFAEQAGAPFPTSSAPASQKGKA
jgi:hypothetical protein